MATVSGLVRSFYGWLVRREQAMPDNAGVLPTNRPTSLSAITEIACHTATVLEGTEHEARANYWKNLFEGIEEKGWHGELRTEDQCRLKIRQELNEVLSGGNMAL